MATPNEVKKGTAKVKSINPLLNSSGEQEKYKDFFKSRVTLDNDIQGTVNSKETSPPYKVGDEVEYEAKYYGNDNQFCNMSIKSKSDRSGRGGSSYHDPERNKQIVRSTCTMAAIEVKRNSPTAFTEHPIVIANKFISGIESKAASDNKELMQQRINLQAGLKMAVANVIIDPELTTPELVIERMYKYAAFIEEKSSTDE